MDDDLRTNYRQWTSGERSRRIVLERIRVSIKSCWRDLALRAQVPVFLVPSGGNGARELCDLPELLHYISSCLPEAKRGTFLRAVPCLTEGLIEDKRLAWLAWLQQFSTSIASRN